MTLKCGTILRTTDDPRKAGAIIWKGDVTMGDMLDGTISLVTNARAAANNNAPQFDIYYTPRRGTERHAGAAWIKTFKETRGTKRDGEFLSLTFDDPKWDAPLNLAAFPGDDAKQPWPITWRRARGGNEAEA